MQIYDVRERRPHRDAGQRVDYHQVLDDGAVSPYGVACVHDARAVIEIALGRAQTMLCCAECGSLLGVVQRPAM